MREIPERERAFSLRPFCYGCHPSFWIYLGQKRTRTRRRYYHECGGGLADTIRPRLEDMGADINRVAVLRGLTGEGRQERPLSLADLDVIEKAIIEHRPALVIVDPIIAYVAGKDTHKANEFRGLLAPLAALAEKFKIAILAIRHLNKGTGKAAYRGQGCVDFLAACRSAFLVGEDPETPGQKVLCHIKANLSPKTASVTYTINNGRFLWERKRV